MEEQVRQELQKILKTLHACQSTSPLNKVNQYVYQLDRLKFLKTFPNLSDELVKELGKPIKVLEDYLGMSHDF